MWEERLKRAFNDFKVKANNYLRKFVA